MSIFSSLISATSSMQAYERSVTVVQNNVANANTPGFARQRLAFIPRRFDPGNGLAGGVDAGGVISYRDGYAERNVWRQNNGYGRSSQQAANLEQIEPYFSVTQGAGVGGALNDFFGSVASWSINPNDPAARQVVLDRANSAARSFNANAEAIGNAINSADREISTTVDRINRITSRIQELNAEFRSDRRKVDDPGLDGDLHASLEELSELVDFSVLREDEGSVQVLLGGQTPLVIGLRQYPLRADFSTGQPVLLESQENDITHQLTDGALKGLVETRTVTLPGYQNDLNTLATAFADRVNQVLAGGVDTNGANPTQDLFTYDAVLGAALTLKTNALSPSDLAGAEAANPGGNGNTLNLAELATSNEIGDLSFSESYGELAARAGRDLSRARERMVVQQGLKTQAQTIRDESSGVSLDEEAARLIEAQRAYQANAQLFQVLNELTETVLGLLR